MDDEGVYSSMNNTLTINQEDVSGIYDPNLPETPPINDEMMQRAMNRAPFESQAEIQVNGMGT